MKRSRWQRNARRPERGVWIRTSSPVLIAAMLCLLSLPALSASAALSSVQIATTSDPLQLEAMTLEELQQEKLRQEILQLQRNNQRGFWGALPVYAPFLTALAALAGILVTLWKHMEETSRQKDLDRAQREAEQQQRWLENKRRTDERFNQIARSLGAKSEALQASSAVSMALFSKPGYEEYYAQAFMLLLANLKINHSPAIQSLLINSFEKIARRYLPSSKDPPYDGNLDFSHAALTGCNLSGLNLTGADIGYAKLRRANLSDAVLRHVRGYEARCEKARFSRADLQAARLHKATFRDCQFHDARLVDAKMRGADLQGAQFHRAQLQGAHLDKEANLEGAVFHQADLNETRFKGATGFTLTTLRSIINAKNWDKAHFDDAVREQLNELAKERKP